MPRKPAKPEFHPDVCARLGCCLPSRPQVWRGKPYCDGCYQRVIMAETRERDDYYETTTRRPNRSSVRGGVVRNRCSGCGGQFKLERLNDDGLCHSCAVAFNN